MSCDYDAKRSDSDVLLYGQTGCLDATIFLNCKDDRCSVRRPESSERMMRVVFYYGHALAIIFYLVGILLQCCLSSTKNHVINIELRNKLRFDPLPIAFHTSFACA